MSNASGQQYAVGLRYAVVFELNTDGRPNATAQTAYEGLEFKGPKAFSLNTPEPRQISHYGWDRVAAVDYLPPTEPVSGEITVSQEDLDLDALLENVTKFNVGEATLLAGASDQQGSEPDVALLLYQQSLDATTKIRNWRFIIIPKARVKALPGGMDENAGENRYTFVAAPSANHLWGAAMVSGTEGAEEAAFFRGQAVYKPKVVAYLGDNSTVLFSFPAAAQAANTDKVAVFVDGTEQTSGITVATTGVTFTTAPALDADIVIFYEVA